MVFTHQVAPDPRARVKKLTRTQGRPLEPEVRRTYEVYFGHDLSSVRVHADESGAESAEALGADAYTVGRHIAFGRGQYAPNSRVGRRLLAHELAHVVQQQAAGPDPSAVDSLPVASPHSGAELSAERAADGLAGAPDVGAAPQAIHRQAKPRAKIKLDLSWGGVEGGGLKTNEQLAGQIRMVIGLLESDLAEVESDDIKARANEWLHTVKGVLPFFDRQASQPIDEGMIPLINYQIDELLAIKSAIQEEKDNRLREALRREEKAAKKAADEAEALRPKLDDALRAAYRKGSSSSLKEAVSTVKGALSIGNNIRKLAKDITTDIGKLTKDITTDIPGLSVPKDTVMTIDKWSSQIGSVKVTIVNVDKYTDMLSKLGRGLSALNIALTVLDRSKRATEVEQGMKDLNDVVSISTDLASFSPVSMPPHVSLITGLWIKPALKVISKQIGMLVEQLSDVNRASVEVTGDLMYPGAEPGGQKMFDLMVKVMQAKDLSGVPEIRGDVADYFYEHREKLEIGAEESVPTSGIIWKSLDEESARAWLFYHRQRVWAMFYGSMVIPSPSRR